MNVYYNIPGVPQIALHLKNVKIFIVVEQIHSFLYKNYFSKLAKNVNLYYNIPGVPQIALHLKKLKSIYCYGATS